MNRSSRPSLGARLLAVTGTVALAGAYLACAPGGAIRGPAPSARQAMLFENLSADWVRVSLYKNSDEFILGRVGPFERRTLLRPRMPESDPVCLIVVPVGTPSVTKPGPLSPGATWSECYSVSELDQQTWTYSGSRILVARLPRP